MIRYGSNRTDQEQGPTEGFGQLFFEARAVPQLRAHHSGKKTGKTKTIALNKQVLQALRLYLPHRRGDFIFASSRGNANAISRVQARRIIRTAAMAVGLHGKISCHSLRKTWGYHAWTSKAVSPVVIMHIYNHSDYAVTRRYLGVDQDALDRAYLGMELFS